VTKPALLTAWLLTPVVVWIGTFTMGWVGARLGGQLIWLVVGGVAGGVSGIVGWTSLVLYLKRRGVKKIEQVGSETP
jgi:hypothetical protein